MFVMVLNTYLVQSEKCILPVEIKNTRIYYKEIWIYRKIYISYWHLLFVIWNFYILSSKSSSWDCLFEQISWESGKKKKSQVFILQILQMFFTESCLLNTLNCYLVFYKKSKKHKNISFNNRRVNLKHWGT